MLVLCIYGKGIVHSLRNKLLHWQISRQKPKLLLYNNIQGYKQETFPSWCCYKLWNIFWLSADWEWINVVYLGSYSGILSAFGLALADVVHEAQEPCCCVYNKGEHNFREIF